MKYIICMLRGIYYMCILFIDIKIIKCVIFYYYIFNFSLASEINKI